MVHRYRDTHDRSHRQNPVHDGRITDLELALRQVGELIAGSGLGIVQADAIIRPNETTLSAEGARPKKYSFPLDLRATLKKKLPQFVVIIAPSPAFRIQRKKDFARWS